MEQEISYIARMDLAGAADESDKKKKAELEKKVAALKSELSKYRNSKEEKDNISDRAIAIAMSYLKDGYKEDKIKKEMMSQYHFSEVQTLSALDYAKKTMHNSKSYYETIIEKKNSLPEFKYCYQAMQWFKEGSQYAEVIDKLVERFHLDKSVAAAAAQKGQQMYEDGYRNK